MGWILLGIYGVTTISSYGLFSVAAKALAERLDREGYTEIEKEKGKNEEILSNIKCAIFLGIPILNFVLACVTFFAHDTFYESYLKDGLKEGTIREKTEEEKQAEKENKEQTKDNELSKQEEQKVQNKPYSAMTIEEKLMALERERAFLLSVNNQETVTSYNDKGAYSKKQNN